MSDLIAGDADLCGWILERHQVPIKRIVTEVVVFTRKHDEPSRNARPGEPSSRLAVSVTPFVVDTAFS